MVSLILEHVDNLLYDILFEDVCGLGVGGGLRDLRDLRREGGYSSR